MHRSGRWLIRETQLYYKLSPTDATRRDYSAALSQNRYFTFSESPQNPKSPVRIT